MARAHAEGGQPVLDDDRAPWAFIVVFILILAFVMFACWSWGQREGVCQACRQVGGRVVEVRGWLGCELEAGHGR